MPKAHWTRYLFLLLAVVCLWRGSELQPRLARLRNRYDLVSRPAREGVPPEYILASALLGGFRGLFITTLWIRAQNMKNDGKFYEMIDIYNIITKLQPNHHSAWAFQSWDLAYNVSVEHDTAEERIFWVFRGVDMLRHQAIPKNEHIPELYWELAWFFHHKIGQETDWANPAYRAHLARQVERVFQIPPENSHAFTSDKQKAYLTEMSILPEQREKLMQDPTFRQVAEAIEAKGFDIFADGIRLYSRTQRPEAVEDLLSDNEALHMVRKARLWTVARNIRRELSMNPAEMFRLADKFGPIDWRTPFAHSLYWSTQSFAIWKKSDPEKPTLKFERLVRFSLISLTQQGRLFQTEDGYPYYVPDFRLFDAAVKHIDETLEYFEAFRKPDGSKVNLVGFKSGYKNFLKDAIFKLYFDNRLNQARRIQTKLIEVSGEEKKFRIPLRRFVKQNFAEWMDSPTLKDSLIFLNSTLATAYFHLAIGDKNAYEYRKALAEYFYRTYCLQRWPAKRESPDDPDHRHTVPPLFDIRKRTVLAIFSGWDPRFRQLLLRNLAVRLQSRDPALMDAVRFEIERQQEARERLAVPEDAAE